MRLRLVDLSLIALAMVGPVSATRAGELDQVRLRGSNAYDAAPAYPIRDGIPIMLPEEARPLD